MAAMALRLRDTNAAKTGAGACVSITRQPKRKDYAFTQSLHRAVKERLAIFPIPLYELFAPTREGSIHGESCKEVCVEVCQVC